MKYQVTVRHGAQRQRYHTYVVEAADAGEALRVASEQMPNDISREADLVEVRVSVDPDERSYVDE
ncbi:MAG: hypothetical protein OEO79_10395 [Gemmatimonadota bacterium]|nr:hypothetical protein [Gemmatimonadota bacterium]MDH3421410.1 hypothetical protein [Gemmatimonadota bacterium]